ncbi:MAG: SPOR domain-containing protein [Bacteroidales bacterium]|nr:SPOR domain-containing protein [Bacteroidales bacterium]
MKKIYLLSLIIALFINQSLGQEFSAQLEIRKYIAEKNKSDLKKLDKAVKEMKDVELLFAEADKLSQSVTKLKVEAANTNDKGKKKIEKKINKIELKEAQKRVDASKASSQVNKSLYNVYKNNFKNARKNIESDEAKKQEGRELETEAVNLYKKAQTKRTQSIKISDQLKAYRILADADELERQALETQLKVYGLYLNWYGNPEENEEPVEEEPEKEYIAEKIDEDLPNFVEPENTEIKTEEYNNTETRELNENKTIEKVKQENIYYKIQIAASKTPLALSHLKSIYNYNLPYNNEKENGYYKYSVGQFESYENADAFKIKMNLPAAFIIAYKNHKKISIAEANPELVNQNTTQNNNPTHNISVSENGTRYRVQISATRIPASNEDVKRMNPSPKQVQIYKMGQWFKYTVGNFSNMQDAKNFKKQYKLDGFVVKYVNGKEVK